MALGIEIADDGTGKFGFVFKDDGTGAIGAGVCDDANTDSCCGTCYGPFEMSERVPSGVIIRCCFSDASRVTISFTSSSMSIDPDIGDTYPTTWDDFISFLNSWLITDPTIVLSPINVASSGDGFGAWSAVPVWRALIGTVNGNNVYIVATGGSNDWAFFFYSDYVEPSTNRDQLEWVDQHDGDCCGSAGTVVNDKSIGSTPIVQQTGYVLHTATLNWTATVSNSNCCHDEDLPYPCSGQAPIDCDGVCNPLP